MRNKWLILISIVTVILLLAACGTSTEKKNTNTNTNTAKTKEKEGKQALDESSYPQLTTAITDKEKVVQIDTSMGMIKIKLFPEYAPKAVENFVKHSEQGYYNGLIFHRVIKGFMIQGGDPKGNGTGGESIWGKPFEDEFSDKLFNLRGALSMANSGPDTNGSQFFIVQAPTVDPSMKAQMEQAGYPKKIIDAYGKNGGSPWLDQHYTVFGQVIDGMDTVDKIANTSVNQQDKPKQDVVIKKIRVIE